MIHLRTLSCLATVMLLACGGAAPGTDEPTAQNQDAIIGGVNDTGDPAIVAVYAIAPGATEGALCTGSVISPTVVLTAAHCVDPAVVGSGVDFYVLTAADLTDPSNPSPKLTVKETHFDPAFDISNVLNGHDVGIVILDTPTTITPIPWNSAPLPESFVGNPVRLVGYGLNDSLHKTGAGIKRQVGVKLNSFDNLFVKTGSLIPWKGLCSGDSGGPVLMKFGGVEKIVGVNSFGIILCVSESSSTRIDTYASFVQMYAP